MQEERERERENKKNKKIKEEEKKRKQTSLEEFCKSVNLPFIKYYELELR